MTKTQKNVPALRFPEFKEGWGNHRLGNVCIKIQDGNYGADYPKQKDFLTKGIPFLTSKAIGGNGSIIEDKIDFISAHKHDSLRKAHLQLDDVLFTNRGANVGTIGFADKRISHGNIGPQLTLLRANVDVITPLFLKEVMKSFPVVKQIRSQDSGSAMNFFGIGGTSKFKFCIPTLPEQQKIASFLSSVDRKIEQLGKKKVLLEQYKKGMMQKLFSQEFRFAGSDENSFPDWEEKRLGRLGDVVTGKTPKTSDRSLWNGKIPFITPTDIGEDTKYLRRTSRKISASQKLRVLPSGAVLFTCIASIGKMCLSTEPSVTNQQINSLVVREPNSFEYVYYALKKISPKIKAAQANTTLPIINKTDFSKFTIKIPAIPEQQKIANFLSSIDQKIDLISTELDHAKTFKKGLLQQMFI